MSPACKEFVWSSEDNDESLGPWGIGNEDITASTSISPEDRCIIILSKFTRFGQNGASHEDKSFMIKRVEQLWQEHGDLTEEFVTNKQYVMLLIKTIQDMTEDHIDNKWFPAQIYTKKFPDIFSDERIQKTRQNTILIKVKMNAKCRQLLQEVVSCDPNAAHQINPAGAVASRERSRSRERILEARLLGADTRVARATRDAEAAKEQLREALRKLNKPPVHPVLVTQAEIQNNFKFECTVAEPGQGCCARVIAVRSKADNAFVLKQVDDFDEAKDEYAIALKAHRAAPFGVLAPITIFAVAATRASQPDYALLQYERAACTLAGRVLSLEAVAFVLKSAAMTLSQLHAAGVLWLDAKPANIVLTTSGHPLLIDFGLAQTAWGPRHTGCGGTPGYWPPERNSGQFGPKSDSYSLGVVVAVLFTGFSADKVLASIAANADAYPADFLSAVDCMTHFEPASRPMMEDVLRFDLLRRAPTAPPADLVTNLPAKASGESVMSSPQASSSKMSTGSGAQSSMRLVRGPVRRAKPRWADMCDSDSFGVP